MIEKVDRVESVSFLFNEEGKVTSAVKKVVTEYIEDGSVLSSLSGSSQPIELDEAIRLVAPELVDELETVKGQLAMSRPVYD